jgi:hypothetical protein
VEGNQGNIETRNGPWVDESECCASTVNKYSDREFSSALDNQFPRKQELVRGVRKR